MKIFVEERWRWRHILGIVIFSEQAFSPNIVVREVCDTFINRSVCVVIGYIQAGLECGSLMLSYFIYPVWGDVIDNNFGFTESAT